MNAVDGILLDIRTMVIMQLSVLELRNRI